MDLLPRYYKPSIQSDIQIRGSCGAFRTRYKSQLQQALNKAVETNTHFTKIIRRSQSVPLPTRLQCRNTLEGFKLPVYTHAIYSPEHSATSICFKNPAEITMAPVLDPVKRIPESNFLPVLPNPSDAIPLESTQTQLEPPIFPGKLARRSYTRIIPYKPPRHMFLGPVRPSKRNVQKAPPLPGLRYNSPVLTERPQQDVQVRFVEKTFTKIPLLKKYKR